MSTINPLAPQLGRGLSKEVAAEVAQHVYGGPLTAGATPHNAALRREADGRDAATPTRPAFVRDAEKIMHLPAYNRLAGKTQVFSLYENDDLSRRGLHVQFVCRIARDIGRALGLNCDLIEAIALGHDLGHTPFGHAGERFLNDVYHKHTKRWFLHNLQSVHVLDRMYGRNVSIQVLDGIACHNGEFESQVIKLSGHTSAHEFDQMVEQVEQAGPDAMVHMRPMTLEGCVVRVSDIIAYVGKDRQDAIRAHLVSEHDFEDGLGGAYNAWALRAFSEDIIENSLGAGEIRMSEEGFAELKRAKAENYEKIYRTEGVSSGLGQGVQELFELLYEHELEALLGGKTEDPIFRHHIEPLSAELAYYGKSYKWEEWPHECVADYLSSMTDDYFVELCQRTFSQAEQLFGRKRRFWRIDARMRGEL